MRSRPFSAAVAAVLGAALLYVQPFGLGKQSATPLDLGVDAHVRGAPEYSALIETQFTDTRQVRHFTGTVPEFRRLNQSDFVPGLSGGLVFRRSPLAQDKDSVLTLMVPRRMAGAIDPETVPFLTAVPDASRRMAGFAEYIVDYEVPQLEFGVVPALSDWLEHNGAFGYLVRSRLSDERQLFHVSEMLAIGSPARARVPQPQILDLLEVNETASDSSPDAQAPRLVLRSDWHLDALWALCQTLKDRNRYPLRSALAARNTEPDGPDHVCDDDEDYDRFNKSISDALDAASDTCNFRQTADFLAKALFLASTPTCVRLESDGQSLQVQVYFSRGVLLEPRDESREAREYIEYYWEYFDIRVAAVPLLFDICEQTDTQPTLMLQDQRYCEAAVAFMVDAIAMNNRSDCNNDRQSRGTCSYPARIRLNQRRHFELRERDWRIMGFIQDLNESMCQFGCPELETADAS